MISSLPSISFPEQVMKMEYLIPKEIVMELTHTLAKKAKGEEKEAIKNIPRYDQYIENFLNERSTIHLKGKSPRKKRLNQVILKLLK